MGMSYLNITVTAYMEAPPYVEADKRPVNVYEITEFLTEGNNTLEVTVFNQADYGGLLYEVELYRIGESEAIRYVSDETTEVSRDGTRWEKARKLGSPEYGEIAAVAYWRRVVEYDSASVLTINHGFMGETLSGTAGETITYHSTSVQMLSDAEKATFDGQTFTGRLYDATDRLYYAVVPVKMTVGETNGVAEFLSGFQKKDKIIPVITLVFYYDLKEWDGSVDLYGMFHWEEWGEGIELLKPYVSNYKINLVDAGNVENLERFKTDLQQIFGMLKYRGEAQGLKNYMKKTSLISKI